MLDILGFPNVLTCVNTFFTMCVVILYIGCFSFCNSRTFNKLLLEVVEMVASKHSILHILIT